MYNVARPHLFQVPGTILPGTCLSGRLRVKSANTVQLGRAATTASIDAQEARFAQRLRQRPVLSVMIYADSFAVLRCKLDFKLQRLVPLPCA